MCWESLRLSECKQNTPIEAFAVIEGFNNIQKIYFYYYFIAHVLILIVIFDLNK